MEDDANLQRLIAAREAAEAALSAATNRFAHAQANLDNATQQRDRLSVAQFDVFQAAVTKAQKTQEDAAWDWYGRDVAVRETAAALYEEMIASS